MKKAVIYFNSEDSIDLGKFLLRFILGFTMLFHGISKLIGGVSFISGMLEGMGLPGFIAYGVIVGEVVAPLMILIGFKSRLGGLIYAFNMIVAILLVHAGDFFTISSHGGWGVENLMLHIFGAMSVVFLGAGRYSLSKGQGDWD